VFEAEDGDPRLMEQPPRRMDQSLVSGSQVMQSVLHGSLVTAVVVGLYAWLLQRGTPAAAAATGAFVVLVTANAALILPSRSARTGWSAMWQGLTPVSRWVLLGTLSALLAVTTIAPLAGAFGFTPLAPLQWVAASGIGLGMLLIFQLTKIALAPRAQP
jgi:Ca2+-transporting ATPase